MSNPMTPYNSHADYYAQMDLLMQALGQVVQRKATYPTKQAYNEAIKGVEQQVASMGNPPCPVCMNELDLIKVDKKYRAQCPSHLGQTVLHTTETRALKATRLWVKEQADE